MRTCGDGRLARFKQFGPAGSGMASAAVLAISLAVGGCETVFVAKAGSETPTTAPTAAHAVDWSKPIPAKILIADFTLGVPPTEFVVGQSYQLEIRNVSSSGRSFVAPGFFRAIRRPPPADAVRSFRQWRASLCLWPPC